MAGTTLDIVAKTAGVSKATVSRVINRSPRVAPAVARQVREAMEQMGYQPSVRRPGPKPPGRKGIRTGNLLLLSVGSSVSGAQAFSGYPLLFHGIERAVHDAGLKLVVAGLARDGVLPAALDSDEVDGVLLFGPGHELSSTAQARLRGLPTVGLLRGFDDLRGKIDRVVYDNDMVGTMAAEYLIARKHARLAFFNFDPEHSAFPVRQRTFAAAAGQHGAEVVPLVASARPANFREEFAACRAMAERLREQRATGLFIVADYQAPQMYQAMEAVGVMPGRDLDVITCDNVPQWMERLTPRPAAIDINYDLIGYRAVEQLLWRLAHPECVNPAKISLEPVLVPGENAV